MPYGWIDPEVFVEYNGMTVYHVYKDDEISQGRREFWYTTDLCGRQIPQAGHLGGNRRRDTSNSGMKAVKVMRARSIAAHRTDKVEAMPIWR